MKICNISKDDIEFYYNKKQKINYNLDVKLV